MRSRIRGADDLASRLLGEINQPSAVIARSMGGVVVTHAALHRTGLPAFTTTWRCAGLALQGQV